MLPAIKTHLRTARRILRGSPLITLDYPYPVRPRHGYGRPPHPELLAIVERNRDAFIALLERMNEQNESLARIPRTAQGASAHWDNGFFTWSDAAALYTLLSLYRPRNFIEIGSGNSTKFARRSIGDHGLDTHVTCIDPAPRAEIEQVADTVHRTGLQEIDLALFERVLPGDFVSLDGSHYCYQNSDTVVFFLEVLPRLPDGVLVHVHDIRIPYDYPEKIRDLWYGEQYVLAAWLLAKRDVRVEWCAAYVQENLRDRLPPAVHGQGGSSFWFWTG